MERELFVYVEMRGKPVLAGRLWTRVRQRTESATFLYDEGWLERSDSFALEPALPLDAAPHHTSPGRALFGSLGDSAPDRWGRELMRRQWRREQAAGGVAATSLAEADFLLRVNDTARLGALRFAKAQGGAFQTPDEVAPIPPLVALPALLSASDAVLADTESAAALRLLLAPGSSLGGARPKASVRSAAGGLDIAKFPASSDEWDVVRWEAVLLRLANDAGIDVPRHRLELVNDRPVLLLSRFDRTANGRVPFLSAMSALGSADHERRSYMELVDFLRQHGAHPRQDMQALWRRLVFNVLVSNTDDHLRNHAFLHVPGCGWSLAPAYDLNPVPTDVAPRILSTAIHPDDAAASLELALEVAPDFGLDPASARAAVGEVARATAPWRETAKEFGLTNAEASRMASAFEHKDRELAERIEGGL